MLYNTLYFYANDGRFLRTWVLINVNDDREIHNQSCFFSEQTIAMYDDACDRNDPVLYGLTHPGGKKFGDDVARYMERNEPSGASK